MSAGSSGDIADNKSKTKVTGLPIKVLNANLVPATRGSKFGITFLILSIPDCKRLPC